MCASIRVCECVYARDDRRESVHACMIVCVDMLGCEGQTPLAASDARQDMLLVLFISAGAHWRCGTRVSRRVWNTILILEHLVHRIGLDFN